MGIFPPVRERSLILTLLPVGGLWAILAGMLMGFLLVLGGYILGSVPTGFLVGGAYGVDVRRVGSGNIGTANVLRAAGKWAAVFTMLGDMLKGLVPVVVARLVTGDEWLVAAVALAAVVGHCFPVFLRFKGGKGVATGAGTSIGLAPVVGIGLFAFWWAVVLVSRYTSLGAIAVMVLSPRLALGLRTASRDRAERTSWSRPRHRSPLGRCLMVALGAMWRQRRGGATAWGSEPHAMSPEAWMRTRR